MEKIQFNCLINATPARVWEILWNRYSYETWTTAFAEGSTVKTDQWKEGSRLYFTDAKGDGMVSEVAANRPNEFMSFRHLGMIKDGVEDTSSPQVTAWNGSLENYTLTEKDGQTLLTMDMDVTSEFREYMEKTWPVAMENIKALAEGTKKPVISISAFIAASPDKVWEYWTSPEHVKQWNQASPDWHCPAASNDLRNGGSFSYTMAAKDGSFSFDFGGSYEEVEPKKYIGARLGDGRSWKTWLEEQNGGTLVTEKFEAEQMNPLDLQQGGWQAILNSFKQHTENN